MEELPPAKSTLRQWNPFSDPLQDSIEELRDLLGSAIEQNVVETSQNSKEVGAKSKKLQAGSQSSESIRKEFRESKLKSIERKLLDYKKALRWSLNKINHRSVYLLIDDFYLIPKDRQADVIDYLHRLVRGEDIYIKIGTVRHRTNLMRTNGNTIGVELNQDVEELNLDYTFDEFDSTVEYLSTMLNSMSLECSIQNASERIFNPDGLEALVLSSGGVPRDFLMILVNAIDSSVSSGKERWLTPTHIYKGASRMAHRTKKRNMRNDSSSNESDLEKLFIDVYDFCIEEKGKTSFLISESESQKHKKEYELIKQLMDYKLIHVIEPDTSAAAGRKGRFEAYTLDFSCFMEPRKRNIDIVEFWKYDDKYRRKGVREAPVYRLQRAKNKIEEDEVKGTIDIFNYTQS